MNAAIRCLCATTLLALPQAPAIAAEPTAGAQLVFVAQNIRDQGVTIRGVRVEQFSPAECVASKKLTNFFLKKHLTERTSEPLAIPAGAALGVTFSFSEGRFAESRGCAVSGTIAPLPGAVYTARFLVTQGTASCAVALVDQHGTAAPFTEREHLCLAGRDDGVPSGSGQSNKFNVRVRAQTAP